MELVVHHLRPMIRFLRKKTVLALIFCLSFAYCILSLHYGFHHRSGSGSGMSRNYAIDYGDGEMMSDKRMSSFRRGGAGAQEDDDDESLINGAAATDVDGRGGKSPQLHTHDQHDRRVHNFDDILEISSNSSDGSCRNSVQGKVLIADDRGFVCQRRDVQMRTGCCETSSSSSSNSISSKRYSCETCSAESHCCAIYEHCISCCMDPEKKELLSKVINSPANSPPFSSSVVLASLTDHFDFCLAKCRTSSSSVQHENSYRDPRVKHCYGNIVTTSSEHQQQLPPPPQKMDSKS